MSRPHERIRVRGARANNLEGVDVDIPRGRLVAVTGVSGSGKSSFAFDTIFREGERRYLSTLAASARLRTGKLERPEVEAISGLGPAVSVSQHLGPANPRSTVGTLTGLWDLVRLLYARLCDPPVQRSLLSFNDEAGACPRCKGLGVVDRVDPELLVADPDATIRGGALVPTLKNGYTVYSQVTVDVMNDICLAHGFDVDTAWHALTDAQREVIFFGTKALVVPFGKHSLESRLKWAGITAKPREEGYYRGLVPVIEETLLRNRNDNVLRFVRTEDCPDCEGSRLGPAPRALRLGGLGPADLARAPLRALPGWLDGVRPERAATQAVLHTAEAPMRARIQTLVDLGLGHLPLGRGAGSLSTGERQRIRLAAQLDDDLAGLTYVLDEPSVDLHPSARHHLQDLLHRLLAAGSSVITVEHDPALIARCDHVLELGPGPGADGGRLLFEGRPADLQGLDTPTGRAIAAERAAKVEGPTEAPEGARYLWIRGPTARNLTGDDVPLRLGALNVITGVSGAGKSTLVGQVLAPALERRLGRAQAAPGAHEAIEGAEDIAHVVTLEPRPIGRTPRSNPATYTGLFDVVRKAFAATDAAKARGFAATRFSFNTAGGRCPTCEGAGVTRVPMHGLGDVSVTCPGCEGRRFDEDTLSVKLFGLDVAQVLALEVSAARDVLASLPDAARILAALDEVGLGYLALGQPATDLSGGEAQRVRLATELARPVRGPALYVLDEPSKGLHPQDLQLLLRAFARLTALGHTLVVVEHDPRVWRAADHLVDLGPGAGEYGGRRLYAGPPAGLLTHETSKTAAILRGEGLHAAPPAGAPAPTSIALTGVRTHNLRAVDVELPRAALTVITGPSGSGKSSLAFDTLAAEAMHRLTGRLGAHVRRLVRRMPRPDFDTARGLTPTVALQQRPPAPQPRSTVGTLTEVQDLLRLLFSRLGTPRGRPASAFSFNAEAGACPRCTGLGFTLAGDPEKLITHPAAPVLDGACAGTKIGQRFTDPEGQHAVLLHAAAERAGLDVEGPFEALGEEARQLVLQGDGGPPLQVVWRFRRGKRAGEHPLEAPWPGLLGLLEEEYRNTHQGKGAGLVDLMMRVPCDACAGGRLGPRALEVTVDGVNLAALSQRPVDQLRGWLEAQAPESARDREVLGAVMAELRPRLDALIELGLGHLHPHRGTDTLSAGELMRTTLAAQIGAPMTGVTYVLDEPTRGLHPADVEALLGAVRRLVAADNTVVLVDHHPTMRAAADHLVVLGPSGGDAGGEITFAGSPADAPRPKTPPAASGRAPRPDAAPIAVRGAAEHNLEGIDVDVPGSGLTVIAGPSGAGKTTFVHAIADAAEGGLHVEWLDARPLDGGWSSVLATAMGLMDPLRDLYAASPEAKAKKLRKAAFSFAGAAGRCPDCKGAGVTVIPLDFLADARATCEACAGTRYRPEVLEVRVNGRSIADSLALDVRGALDTFAALPKLRAPLAHLDALGLGYLRLDRATPTLSGGEAQRVRIARFLAAPAEGPRLLLLDEPTRGLDPVGVAKVQTSLHQLVGQGHPVVVISHDLAVTRTADHVIELGPGGGPEGGRIVFEGTPEALGDAETATGRALRTSFGTRRG